jgi:hypothetical protein
LGWQTQKRAWLITQLGEGYLDYRYTPLSEIAAEVQPVAVQIRQMPQKPFKAEVMAKRPDPLQFGPVAQWAMKPIVMRKAG